MLICVGVVATQAQAAFEVTKNRRRVTTHIEIPTDGTYRNVETSYDRGTWVEETSVTNLTMSAQAWQDTEVREDGNQLVITGRIQNSQSWGATQPQALINSSCEVFLELTSDGPFSVQGTFSVQTEDDGFAHMYLNPDEGFEPPNPYYLQSWLFAAGEHTLDYLHESPGAFHLVLQTGGWNFNFEPDQVGGEMEFELRVGPAQVLATEESTFDRVKALYR